MINNGYTGITIAFKRLMKSTSLDGCKDMFTADSVTTFGAGALCHTIENQKIVVSFGRDYILASTTFYINYLKVTAATGDCSFSPIALPVPLKVNDPTPPIAVLTAPSLYSKACSSTGLSLSALNSRSSIPGSLGYKWELTAAAGAVTSAYAVFSTSQSLITLNNGQLEAGTLNIKLSVKDRFSTSTTSGAVQVTQEPILSVVFDCGNTLTRTTEVQQRVRAQVESRCDSTVQSYNYVWSLQTSSTKTGVDTVLSTQSGPYITIKKGVLTPGTYEFLCIVSDVQGNSGSAVLYVTITSSPLMPVCDTLGYPLSPAQKLQVSCVSSYDPDNRSVVPSGSWTCQYAGKNCVDVNGSPLVFSSVGLTQTVEGNKMVPNEEYRFTLTLTKGLRTSSPLTLVFPITGLPKTQVSVPSPSRQSNQKPFRASITISTSQPSVTVTTIDPDQVMARSTNALIPITVIIPHFLGGSFTLIITYSDSTGSANIAYLAMISAPPNPGKFVVSPSTGVALSTTFSFTTTETQDRDGPDYPITFTYGYTDSAGIERLFTLPSTSPYTTSPLSFEMKSLLNKVCDSANSCDYATASVTLTKANSRALQSSSVTEIFDLFSRDENSLFSACIMVAQDLQLTATDWSYIFDRVAAAAYTFKTISDNQLMTEITCLEALIALPEHQNSGNLQKVLTVITDITSQYQDGSYEKVFRRQLDAIQKYNVTTIGEITMIESYFDSIESLYITTNYPDQPGVNKGGDLATTFMQRLTAPSLLNCTYTSDRFGVTFPESFAANRGIKDADVLNLWFKIYNYSGYPAGLVSAQMEISGYFGNYTWVDYERPVLVPIAGLSEAVNVTLPLHNASALAGGAQCVKWLNKNWSNQDCIVLSINSTTVTVSTTSLIIMTVVPKSLKSLLGEPLPAVVPEAPGCDQYYTPIVVVSCLVFVAVITGVSLYWVGPRENKKEEDQVKEVLIGHYLLGLIIYRRVVNVWLLLTVLLSQNFFLGVFYYYLADSRGEGTETSMSFFFESYGKDDVLYFIWAIVISFVLSLILTTLFAPTRPRTISGQRLICLCGLTLCALLIILFVVLISLLNTAVCYEYAGRWSVGVLWAFLTEVLVVEFVVAAYRWLLLKLIRTNA